MEIIKGKQDKIPFIWFSYAVTENEKCFSQNILLDNNPNSILIFVESMTHKIAKENNLCEKDVMFFSYKITPINKNVTLPNDETIYEQIKIDLFYKIYIGRADEAKTKIMGDNEKW